MGRVLRKHGDQRPHFHHFIAMPDENYLAGLDSKEYVQELNWVRELGRRSECSRSSRRPASTPNCWSAPNSVGTNCGPAIRFEDLEVETVQGNVNLEQLLDELTVEATEILLDELWLEGNEWRRMTGKPRWRHFVTRKPSRRRAPARLVALPALPRATDGVRRTIDGVVKRPLRKPLRHDSHNERRPPTTREHRATVSRLMRARLERAIHTSRSRHRRRRKTTNPVKRQPRRKTLIHQSPQFRIDRRRVTSAGA